MHPTPTEPDADLPPPQFRPLPGVDAPATDLPPEFAEAADSAVPPPAPTLPAAVNAPSTITTAPTVRRHGAGRIVRSLFCAAIISAVGSVWFYWHGQSPQESYDAAIQLVNKGNLAGAFPLLQEAAAGGIAAAYMPLGQCYAQGVGTTANAPVARTWYTKAEQAGVAAATVALADMDFAEQEYPAAITRYRQAELLLNAQQCYQCAEAYHRSAPNAADPADFMQQAIYYYSKAAEQGHAAAAMSLGTCCYKGLGCPQSVGAAIKWFTVAAEQGDAEAQFRLAWCLLESAPEQAATAVQWLARAAEQGNAAAAYDLAVCYLNGNGTAASPELAARYLQQAAAQEHPAAMRRLAFCYRDATGLPRDIPQALHYFAKAAAAGDAEAQFNYAWSLHHGYGVQKNLQAALPLYLKAAAQQYAPAQDALHALYLYPFLPEIVRNLLQKSQNYPKM
ncbi:MAG: sel1 repeat family protein [Akkermansia sp.]|nr:sel1 repeat family protein [Akkermansia sp.]